MIQINKKTCKKWYGYRHDFNMWEEIERGKRMGGTPITWGLITYIVQERRCIKCGFKQMSFKEY